MINIIFLALILDGFTKVNGWTFYKIKVKGTMTNFNVHKACEGNNLSTPCYAGTYDTFNSDECEVVFPRTVTEDADTMQYLTIMLCNHRKPHECDALKDIFVFKNNWVGDSACGAIAGKEGGYCAYGERYNNLWALCAAADGKLILLRVNNSILNLTNLQKYMKSSMISFI